VAVIVIVCRAYNIKTAAAFADWLAPQNGTLFSLIYFFGSFCVYYISHNYVISQAMPDVIPQIQSAFYPHRYDWFIRWRAFGASNLLNRVSVVVCLKKLQECVSISLSSVPFSIFLFSLFLLSYLSFLILAQFKSLPRVPLSREERQGQLSYLFRLISYHLIASAGISPRRRNPEETL